MNIFTACGRLLLIHFVGLRMLLGSFPSFATEIIQTFLKPSPPWPIPVLRREAISGVRAVVHSALQKNQLLRSHGCCSFVSMCLSRLTIMNGHLLRDGIQP